jgi:DNA-binding IscR family transcriptional regulator
VSPKEIKIIDIIRSIDGNKSFEECILGFEHCSDEKPCPLHSKWAEIREQIIKMFSEKSVADFRDLTLQKLSSLL